MMTMTSLILPLIFLSLYAIAYLPTIQGSLDCPGIDHLSRDFNILLYSYYMYIMCAIFQSFVYSDTSEQRPPEKRSTAVKRHGTTHIDNLRKQPNSQQRPKDMLPRVVVVRRFHCSLRFNADFLTTVGNNR